MKIFYMLCAVFLCLVNPVQAYVVYCTNCSDKFTQNLERVTNLEKLQNMIKSYDQYVHQTMQQIEMVRQNIEQYANMVKNTIQLPKRLIDEITGNFQKLAQVTQTLSTLRGDVSALGQIHQALYQSQEAIGGMVSAVPNEMAGLNKQLQAEWDKWSKRVDEATEATFQVSGSQLNDMQKDSEKFQTYINDLLSTPEGQQQALMAGNQLASLQIQEMRQLRELMATQIQSQLASQNKKEKESQTAKELGRKLFDTSILRGLTPKDDPF